VVGVAPKTHRAHTGRQAYAAAISNSLPAAQGVPDEADADVARRHAATFFDLYEPERRAINLLLDEMRLKVLGEDKAVQGFNVGINCGATAGQTIMHCHVHLIPRRPGDVDQPRGGVRAIIPGKAAY
jgi:hypothetical protein